MSLILDMGFDTPAEEMERGGKCNVPGWYSCLFHEVKINEKSPGKLDFVYEITAGPYNGQRLYDTVNLPGFSNDTSGDEGSKKKLGIVASRFGLWDGVPGHPVGDWETLTGRPCVIEVQKRTYPDPRTGDPRETTGPTFAGIMPPDHYRIPDDVRARLKLPAAKPKEEKPAAGQTTLFTPAPARNGNHAPVNVLDGI